jgi:hypothetical protein
MLQLLIPAKTEEVENWSRQGRRSLFLIDLGIRYVQNLARDIYFCRIMIECGEGCYDYLFLSVCRAENRMLEFEGREDFELGV